MFTIYNAIKDVKYETNREEEFHAILNRAKRKGERVVFTSMDRAIIVKDYLNDGGNTGK